MCAFQIKLNKCFTNVIKKDVYGCHLIFRVVVVGRVADDGAGLARADLTGAVPDGRTR
jgi:hypothetical protein